MTQTCPTSDDHVTILGAFVAGRSRNDDDFYNEDNAGRHQAPAMLRTRREKERRGVITDGSRQQRQRLEIGGIKDKRVRDR